jgi:hypothetical protein
MKQLRQKKEKKGSVIDLKRKTEKRKQLKLKEKECKKKEKRK